MPRYYPNQLFVDCWSSVGNVTFYHRDGLCYWRSKSTLEFAGTASQLRALDVHRRALNAWRGVPCDEKARWRELAEPVQSHRPPFGIDGGISGYNLFVSAYHGFAALGNEHIPVPTAFREFPSFALDFAGADCVGTLGMRLKFILAVDSAVDVNDYALLGKIQLTYAGKGCNPGKMKNVLASEVVPICSGIYEVSFVIDDYRNFCGIDENRYSIHMRYLLIDRERGYRSMYQKLSALFSLT